MHVNAQQPVLFPLLEIIDIWLRQAGYARPKETTLKVHGLETGAHETTINLRQTTKHDYT